MPTSITDVNWHVPSLSLCLDSDDDNGPLQGRLEELEEELEIERASRAKAEKARQVLSRDLEEMGEKLEESGNATQTQIELNRKRESELAKMKEEYDSNALQHESALANLRQKHNAVIADLGDQIDQLNKAKIK